MLDFSLCVLYKNVGKVCQSLITFRIMEDENWFQFICTFLTYIRYYPNVDIIISGICTIKLKTLKTTTIKSTK